MPAAEGRYNMDNDMRKEERQQDEEVVIVQIEGADGTEDFAQDIIIARRQGVRGVGCVAAGGRGSGRFRTGHHSGASGYGGERRSGICFADGRELKR